MARMKFAAAAALASGLFALAHGGAEARIVCDGEFQIIQGRPQSTPYCRDTYLVQVAHDLVRTLDSRPRQEAPEQRWN